MKRYKQRYEKAWITIQKLSEGISLSDLTKHAGISDFTKPFMQDRKKLKGAGNVSSEFIDCIVNKQENYVRFEFRSAPTYPNEKHKKTVPGSNFALTKTPIYIQEIKILKFFDWLSVFEGEEITTKEIKEIFDVSEIQVFCNCPMFHWQSPNYYLSTEFDGSIYPTSIAAPVWGPLHNDGDGLVCKHLDLVLNSIKFWYSPMASKLQGKLYRRGYI